MTGRRARSAPQLAEFLGLPRWQLDRAVEAGTVPPQDRSRGWSADTADDVLARIEEIKASAGTVPDCGAHQAAAFLTERLGLAVTGNGVAELARRGLIRSWPGYVDWPVYSGRDLEVFTDGAAAASACHDGRLQTADAAAVHLLIRRADFGHIVRAGLLAPASWGRGPYDRRDEFSVPLYRTGDLDALARRTDVGWDAVRALRKGQRSPLAALPTRNPDRSTR